MATRDRTVLFVQYRNSFTKVSQQIGGSSNGGMRNRQQEEDEQNLLGGSLRNNDATTIEMNSLQPKWMDLVQEIEEDLKQISLSLQQMDTLQKKSILTTFDDSDDRQVDRMTSDITLQFSRVQQRIKQVGRDSEAMRDPTQQLMGKNAMTGLASKLSDLSTRFRNSQNQYLAKIRGRDTKANDFLVSSGLDQALDAQKFDMGFTQQQLQQLNTQSEAISEREKQIEDVAKSIFQLAEIFRDMQTLVVDQGTILDRIDYNIDLVRATVEPAFEELKKAEQYQKNSKFKYCVILLVLLVFILLLVIMFKPKRK